MATVKKTVTSNAHVEFQKIYYEGIFTNIAFNRNWPENAMAWLRGQSPEFRSRFVMGCTMLIAEAVSCDINEDEENCPDKD